MDTCATTDQETQEILSSGPSLPSLQRLRRVLSLAQDSAAATAVIDNGLLPVLTNILTNSVCNTPNSVANATDPVEIDNEISEMQSEASLCLSYLSMRMAPIPPATVSAHYDVLASSCIGHLIKALQSKSFSLASMQMKQNCLLSLETFASHDGSREQLLNSSYLCLAPHLLQILAGGVACPPSLSVKMSDSEAYKKNAEQMFRTLLVTIATLTQFLETQVSDITHAIQAAQRHWAQIFDCLVAVIKAPHAPYTPLAEESTCTGVVECVYEDMIGWIQSDAVDENALKPLLLESNLMHFIHFATSGMSIHAMRLLGSIAYYDSAAQRLRDKNFFSMLSPILKQKINKIGGKDLYVAKAFFTIRNTLGGANSVDELISSGLVQILMCALKLNPNPMYRLGKHLPSCRAARSCDSDEEFMASKLNKKKLSLLLCGFYRRCLDQIGKRNVCPRGVATVTSSFILDENECNKWLTWEAMQVMNNAFAYADELQRDLLVENGLLPALLKLPTDPYIIYDGSLDFLFSIVYHILGDPILSLMRMNDIMVFYNKIREVRRSLNEESSNKVKEMEKRVGMYAQV